MSEFWKKFSLDAYDRKARLQPALVVALPLIFSGLAWFPEGIISWGTLGSVLAYGGGAALLVQFGRDMGKKREPWLFETWGGKPTTKLLRHRGAANQALLAQRHEKLDELIPGIDLPTAEEEAENPKQADDVYEACTSFLRERTRDNDLVFAENCNYGFRRNLWGMKPVGLTLAIVGTAAVGIRSLVVYLEGAAGELVIAVALLVNIGLLIAWTKVITPSWVKLAADAYAERLLSSLD